MPHYMIQFKYSQDALKALIATPQDRTTGARRVVEDFGGKMHHFYMAFGEFDGLAIAEYPDAESATASVMALNASGGVSATMTTVLIPADQALSAMKKAHATKSGYRPPQG